MENELQHIEGLAARSQKGFSEQEIQALLAERLALRIQLDRSIEEARLHKSQKDLLGEVVALRDAQKTVLEEEVASLREQLYRLYSEVNAADLAYRRGVSDGVRIKTRAEQGRTEKTYGHKVGQWTEQVLRKVFPDSYPWLNEDQDSLLTRSSLIVPKIVNSTVGLFNKGKEYLLTRVAKPLQAYFAGITQDSK